MFNDYCLPFCLLIKKKERRLRHLHFYLRFLSLRVHEFRYYLPVYRMSDTRCCADSRGLFTLATSKVPASSDLDARSLDRVLCASVTYFFDPCRSRPAAIDALASSSLQFVHRLEQPRRLLAFLADRLTRMSNQNCELLLPTSPPTPAATNESVYSLLREPSSPPPRNFFFSFLFSGEAGFIKRRKSMRVLRGNSFPGILRTL